MKIKSTLSLILTLLGLAAASVRAFTLARFFKSDVVVRLVPLYSRYSVSTK